MDLAHDPGQLLTELNRLLAGDLGALDMFITAELISLSPDGTSYLMANAGHSEALSFSPGDASAREVPSAGDMPLGVMPDTLYQNKRATIEPGEVICLVTDGLYELEDSTGEMLGFERMCALLPRWWTGQIQSFTGACLAHLKLIQRDHQSDDRTLVAITQNPA